MALQMVSPLEAQAQGTILDLCEPAEHEALHISGSTNVPLSRLEAEARGLDPQEPYVLACRSGMRAQLGAQRLAALGFERIAVIEGGLQAWEAAGLPVVRTASHRWSMERQVRLAAGSLAFTGAVLGATLHPYFHGLSGFVGAGLIFAALTDTCGMALLLAKLPWNQRAQRSAPLATAPSAGA